jgi:hypothetical protein
MLLFTVISSMVTVHSGMRGEQMTVDIRSGVTTNVLRRAFSRMLWNNSNSSGRISLLFFF